MKSFAAFFKKELLESLRSGKLMILAILFAVFGIMNPAIAKLTPWLLEVMAGELAESGMTVTSVTVDALTSWTQFFKNIPMALVVFACLYGGIFTKEYENETLILVLTKGLSRYKVVLSKTLLMLTLWTLGYWLCFAVTYAYNAYYWDNSIAQSLLSAILYWWLFGILVIALMVLFSVITKAYSGVLIGAGGCVLAMYLLELLPKLSDVMPTSLMQGMSILIGAKPAADFLPAVLIAAASSVLLVLASVLLFNKKEL